MENGNNLKNGMLEKVPALDHYLRGHQKRVNEIAYHPIGNDLVTGSEDKKIMLWKLDQPLATCHSFEGHSAPVLTVAYSPNGRMIASGAEDCRVRLWTPTIRGGSHAFKVHSGAVRSLAFSPDGEMLLTGSNDKCVKLWCIKQKRFLASFVGHTNWVRSVCFSPDGSLIASCGDDGTVRIWDQIAGVPITTLASRRGGKALCASFFRTGNAIAVSRESGSVLVYDIRTEKLLQYYSLHAQCTSVAWHPHCNYFATAGSDGTVKIVDAMEGKPLYTLEVRHGPINCVRFSPNGETFATTGDDKHIMVWKTNFIESRSSNTLLPLKPSKLSFN